MRVIAVLLPLALMAACAGRPTDPDSDAARAKTPRATRISDTGERLATTARQLVGIPYRFGASGPHAFDCSGLVFYVHDQLGMRVPRTAAEQFLFARPVERDALRAGDLVFFRQTGPAVTHVGIYTGDGLFVHAPQSGRAVAYGSLDEDYYRVNFAGAGRIYRDE